MYLSCHSIFEVVDMFHIWISVLIIAWKTKNMSMFTLALTSLSWGGCELSYKKRMQVVYGTGNSPRGSESK